MRLVVNKDRPPDALPEFVEFTCDAIGNMIALDLDGRFWYGYRKLMTVRWAPMLEELIQENKTPRLP